MTRLAPAVTLALLALAPCAAPAFADLPAPGPNGTIIFTSGRDDGTTVLSDTFSQLWTITSPNSTATRRTTAATDATMHHRHAAWSPDHTKVAYAAGATAAGGWDIWVRDTTQPISATNPIKLPQTTGSDRPAWSPDGTRIAYQQDGLGGTLDINARAADGTGPVTPVAVNVGGTMTSASSPFPRPHWSPDSSTIFYGRFITTTNYDIYRAPAGGGNTAGTPVVADPASDFQPQVSPDGIRLCLTRQNGANKDIFIASTAGGVPSQLVGAASAADEYECAWSPDVSKVVFVRGAGSAGQVLMANSDGTGSADPVADVPARFDGNPDWAMNPSPTCQNGNVNVAFNSFVQIPLACTDVPEPFQTAPQDVTVEIVTPPSNGALRGLSNNTVIYTPNVNFSGQDSFTFRGTDGTSNSATATVSITVAGPTPPAARVEALTVSKKRWRRGSRLPSISRAPIGTRIGVRLSAAGRVKLTFRRARPGRRVNGRCVRPTRRNRARRRCTRFVRAGVLSFDGKQGQNTLRFQGRLTARKRLPLGSYRMSATVTSNGTTSGARTVSFRIVRR